MSSNGTAKLDERLRPLIEPIQQEIERIRSDRKAVEDKFKKVERKHQGEMQAFEREELRLKDALRALGVKVGGSGGTKGKGRRSGPQPGSSSNHVGVTRANGTATGFGVSMELGNTYADAILEAVDRKEAAGEEPVVTQKELYKSLDDDQTKASAAFRWLRSIEFLGKAGSDPSSRRELWRVLDRDAAKQALAAAQQRRDEEMEAAHA